MRLTREVRCWLIQNSSRLVVQPLNSWSGTPSIDVVAPFWMVRGTVVGEVHPVTGMLWDIRALDLALRESLSELEVGARPTVAKLLEQLWGLMQQRTGLVAALTRLEVSPSPFVRYTVNKADFPMISMTQQYEFSAAHRLHCRELSAEENLRMFGKCNHPQGHGHNYVVEVTVCGSINSATGTVMPIGELDAIVHQHVIKHLDHRHLNEDLDEFRDLNPTVENIAGVLWQRLVDAIHPASLTHIRLYETPKTWVDIEAGDAV